MQIEDYLNERLTQDDGLKFAPSRYSLRSKNDVIISPYKTYDLFYEINFHVIQKLGMYEDVGSPIECLRAMKFQKDMQWIPVTWEEADEEYKRLGYGRKFTCLMPDDGQNILVRTKKGDVFVDTCYETDSLNLYSGYDWCDDIDAWMPVPK